MDLRRGVGEPVTSDPTGLYGSLPRFLDGSRTGGMMEKQADRSMHPYLASSVIIIRGRRAKLAPVAGTGTHARICLYRTTHDAALIHRWGRRRGTRAAKLVSAARGTRSVPANPRTLPLLQSSARSSNLAGGTGSGRGFVRPEERGRRAASHGRPSYSTVSC
jgi:hypothetical protein